jgi:protein-S-isoprenylcysteine O-methyltransferase Ste14
MKYNIGVILVIVGVVLLVVGLNTSESIGSEISHFLSGTSNNTSVWMIVAGTISSLIGLFFTLRTRRRKL